MHLQPLADRLVVKPLDAETVSKSGIVIPDTAKEKPQEGEVIAVGPGRMLETGQRASMSVAVGNKVLFKKYSPEEIKVDGEEYLVLDERDILAIIE